MCKVSYHNLSHLVGHWDLKRLLTSVFQGWLFKAKLCHCTWSGWYLTVKLKSAVCLCPQFCICPTSGSAQETCLWLSWPLRMWYFFLCMFIKFYKMLHVLKLINIMPSKCLILSLNITLKKQTKKPTKTSK